MSDSISKYIKLFEEELDSLRAVGVTNPEETDKGPVDVDVTFATDLSTGDPQKNVDVWAGEKYGDETDPEELRSALHDAGIDLPDEPGAEPNNTGINVTVSDDGSVSAQASGDSADELLSILKNAGLYKGDVDA